MTRKDFELIARAMAETRPPAGSPFTAELREQWEKDILALARMCEAQNPRFNRQKFREACDAVS
jgi:hypothetical protein